MTAATRQAGFLMLAVTMAASASVARAELGGTAATFAPESIIAGSARQTVMAGYSLHEIRLTGGTRVREYLDAGGIVIAVSWSGPFMPDLRQLLGSHFSTLVDQAASKPRAGQGALLLARPEVVIESGGHMRAWQGRAWLPDRLPAGLNANDID
jgi:hypothetical protein